jgi:membrane-associated protein
MEILNFILHIDVYLGQILDFFGVWTYVMMFGIIFAETGFVVTPFLPGDSLIFTVGAFAGSGYLNIWLIYILMLLAAILGDSVNYWVGHYLGPRVFSAENSKFFNKAYLEKTRKFYAKHGGKTIILARFFPIIRTFAPFVAGVGKMHYRTFLLYNIVGGFIWVSLFTFLGYFFGGLAFVQKNFEYLVLGIISISFVPMITEFIKHRRGTKLSSEQLQRATYDDITEVIKSDIDKYSQ